MLGDICTSLAKMLRRVFQDYEGFISMKLLKIEDLLVPVTNIKLATMGSNIILFRHGDGDHNTLRRNPNLTPLKKHVFQESTVLESSDPLLTRSG